MSTAKPSQLREDLALQSRAIELDWTVERHRKDKGTDGTPQFPLIFHKGRKVLWRTVHGWTCAEILDQEYRHCRHYTTLYEALEKESD